MALTLEFCRGKAFYLDDDKYVVTKVHAAGSAELRGPGEQVFDVSVDKMTELSHGVRVHAGFKGDPRQVRLVFEAPKDVTVLREALYKRKQG